MAAMNRPPTAIRTAIVAAQAPESTSARIRKRSEHGSHGAAIEPFQVQGQTDELVSTCRHVRESQPLDDGHVVGVEPLVCQKLLVLHQIDAGRVDPDQAHTLLMQSINQVR